MLAKNCFILPVKETNMYTKRNLYNSKIVRQFNDNANNGDKNNSNDSKNNYYKVNNNNNDDNDSNRSIMKSKCFQ